MVHRRPLKLLDLFCGQGGAGMGYHRAGFEVVGVDAAAQKRYPFEFHRADAMTFPLDGFDVVHASPPCQAYSATHSTCKARPCPHPRLIEALRERLETWGGPYVIENVQGAPLKAPVLLCGAAYGLGAAGRTLRRHRLFESNQWLMSAGCMCSKRSIGVYGHGSNRPTQGERRGWQASKAEAIGAMGIDWMSHRGLSQAIPPAYTHHLGEQILHWLN